LLGEVIVEGTIGTKLLAVVVYMAYREFLR